MKNQGTFYDNIVVVWDNGGKTGKI